MLEQTAKYDRPCEVLGSSPNKLLFHPKIKNTANELSECDYFTVIYPGGLSAVLWQESILQHIWSISQIPQTKQLSDIFTKQIRFAWFEYLFFKEKE